MYRNSFDKLCITAVIIACCGVDGQAEPPQGMFLDPISLGDDINSLGFDWAPVVSTDGLELYYWSTAFGDEADIFVARRQHTSDEFDDVENLGNGINTIEHSEQMGDISVDGKRLYYSVNGPFRGGGIHVASRDSRDQPFGNSLPISEINDARPTAHAPVLTRDELTIYFVDRYENDESSSPTAIFQATRATRDAPFSNIVPLANVNTDYDDRSPSLSTDELTLLISSSPFSNRPHPGGFGGVDIWVSTRATVNDDFSEPINLNDMWPGSEINTFSHEITPSFSPDWPAAGSKLYYVANPSAGGDIWEATWHPALTGDLNGNGTLDASDIDLLSSAIRAGDSREHFDLDGDGSVNADDRFFWISAIRSTWIGDANLDGVFNSSDFALVFQSGKYNRDELATWSEGDWTGDGRFGSDDLIAALSDGGYEQGTRAATNPVPEPASAIILAIGLTIARLRKKHHEIAVEV